MASSRMKQSGQWHVDARPGRREWFVWLPTLLGVGVLLLMLVLAAHRLTTPPPDGISVLPLPVTPDWPDPTVTRPPVIYPPAATTAPKTETPPGTKTQPPPTTRTPSTRPPSSPARTTRPATTPPAPPPVTGRYRVVESYGDGFIGEVLVANATTAPADWVVTLRFPANVGDLNTSWVEGAPQATQTESGGTLIWRSGVPVDAGATVALRFHFARQGAGDRPQTCTVNGSPCG